MARRSGRLVKLADGRKGIVYNDENPLPGNKLMIRLLDDSMKPLIDGEGKKVVSCKKIDEIQFIGFID